MEPSFRVLSKEQYIGSAILLAIAAGAWLFIALWPQPPLPERPDIEAEQRAAWRQDSLRRDSLRNARWEHKKDSFRRVDDARFAQWAWERQQRYDSFRHADSLWYDSVGWHFARHIKIDTVLDLNHTDTAELQLLRGIGAYTALRIVLYGEQLGGYYSPEQLRDEALMGLHLDTLLHHFIASAEDVRRIDVNHSSVDRLAHHPYLRYTQAKAIYQLRRRQVRLTDINQLLALPDFTPAKIDSLRPYLSFE